MTKHSKDIVERLKKERIASLNEQNVSVEFEQAAYDAGLEILRLRAQNERYREALVHAEFLADRLSEYEPDDDDECRCYYGHVEPALARFNAARTALEDGE